MPGRLKVEGDSTLYRLLEDTISELSGLWFQGHAIRRGLAPCHCDEPKVATAIRSPESVNRVASGDLRRPAETLSKAKGKRGNPRVW